MTEQEAPASPIVVSDSIKPMLENYLGIWAIESSHGASLYQRVSGIDIVAHMSNADPATVAAVRSSDAGAEKQIKVFEIRGTMTKFGSSLSGAGSTVMMRKMIRQAANDQNVSSIVLMFDSPGGTSAGTDELAREVAAAKKKKDVIAFVEDCCCSAAYWVASQATAIVANTSAAMVGSIGTYMAVYDCSAAMKQQGVRLVQIKTGAYKGAGFPGSEITKEQEEHWQGFVNETQAVFSNAVKEGRKLSKSRVDSLADGRIWTAEKAIDEGLVDELGSFDSVIERLQMGKWPKKERKMSATYEEIVAACPNADSDFIVKQLASKSTVEVASAAWLKALSERAEAAEKRAAEAEAKASAAAQAAQEAEAERRKASSVGVPPIKSSTKGADPLVTGDAVAEWEEKIAEAKAKGMSNAKAASFVNAQNPGLREAYVKQFNAARS